MNRGTYEALRQVGASEQQAIVLAAAIPDVDASMSELRRDVDLRFAELRADLERRLNAQTWTIVGMLVAVGGLVAASNLLA